jgi:hypothetical protein
MAETINVDNDTLISAVEAGLIDFVNLLLNIQGVVDNHDKQAK